MRVLIFSANIGEGHDLPARAVRDAILERHPDAEVTIRGDSGATAPAFRGAVLADRTLPPTRALASRLLTALAGRRLLDVIAHRSRPISAACVIAVGAFR